MNVAQFYKHILYIQDKIFSEEAYQKRAKEKTEAFKKQV
jgi:hypothetical protein